MLNVNVLARRWPYILFHVASASLFLALVIVFPWMPYFVAIFCFIFFVRVWLVVLKARLIAVGLRPSLLTAIFYGLSVYMSCVLLFSFLPKGRYFVPALFVLLNLPLAILKEISPEKPDASPLE